MEFQHLTIAGAYKIVSASASDERGRFMRVFDRTLMAQQGLRETLDQCSISYNPRRGTVRGIHYQIAPYEESKVVRCVRGAVFDVLVDVRPTSTTSGHIETIELSDPVDAVYIPEGVAHGFQTLRDDTILLYMMSAPHVPSAARGIRWNDARLEIAWPMEPSVISERDSNWPDLAS